MSVTATVDKENWAKLERTEELGKVEIHGGTNTALAYHEVRNQVTPIDVDLQVDRLIQLISGTNGGGKTQYLQLLGTHLVLGEHLGYLPAEFAKFGPISFLDVTIAGGEHTESASSFQNEVKRIQAMLERIEKIGCPAGGVVLIDEPFKGTSEEDAVPLLIGLMKYCADRQIRLVATTHFSSVFEYLDKLEDAELRRAVHPLYVDYFSETDKFKVREGIGKSSGLRIAAELGLPPEIIAYAEEYIAAAKLASQSKT